MYLKHMAAFYARWIILSSAILLENEGVHQNSGRMKLPHAKPQEETSCNFHPEQDGNYSCFSARCRIALRQALSAPSAVLPSNITSDSSKVGRSFHEQPWRLYRSLYPGRYAP